MNMTEKTKKKMISAAYLGPSVIGVMVFFVIPFCVIIYYSLVDNPINREFVFLQNFINILNNQAFLKAAKNTATFSLITVPLAVILSLGLALLLDEKIPYKSQFRTFFLSPMMVPVASVVLIWQVLFHYNGAVNGVLANLGIDKIDWLKSEYSQVVVGLLFLWKNLGYNMILFMAGIANISKELVEVARLETSNPWTIFVHIKLRYLSPTILFVTILSLINSFKVFRETYLMTGDYPYDSLYLLQNFMNNTFQSLDYQKLSAAAIIMAAVMVLIIGALFIAEERFGKDVEG
ncbi:carbohydrate ABC transporter permease [Acetivibrio ethanolgignens]|uniref:Sugar ABC transporter permease n=1 Tax=Acetivibrio ethanolgignens TaxID=290052 RepID=A0A0V8QD45_9FIRM|nr:sugar ABC transporter permease [Acetivibrio ethanolgignens]KSV58334.1 sugar ABC transporter permease [Acetivibrio ethanolgignens]